MVEIRHPLPEVTSTTATTSESLSTGDTTFTVDDASSFSANDYILIEQRGHEYCELKQISSIASNDITVDSAIELPHDSSITITKLNYNEYLIEESTNGSTYSSIDSGTLDYTEKHGKIVYDYSSWDKDNYYRISFVNSQTSTTDNQTPVQQAVNTYGWIDVGTLRTETGITTDITDTTIISGIKYGVERILDNIYNQKILKTTAIDTTFDLDISPLTLGDYNADDTIDVDDFIIYEEDDDGVRTYIPHLVAKVLPESHRIIFKEQMPRDTTKTLVMWAPVTYREHSSIKSTLETINKLYALNYILTNVPIAKLSRGVTSWTAGGTTVNLDPNAVQDSIAKNREIINVMQNTILKIYMNSSKLRTTASVFRSKTGGMSIRTPSGLIYTR